MRDETITAEFTADLRDFLQRRGYTYILSLGIDPKEVNDASEPETEKENYWLAPVKNDDKRLEAHPGKSTLQIDDPQIITMAAGEENIQYMVKVPLVDYNDYLAKR